MPLALRPTRRIVWLAVLFEGGLGALAVAIARWFELPLLPRLHPTGPAVLRGALATFPMLVALAWLLSSAWPPVADLRRRVLPLVAELFRGARWYELAAVAVAAAVGEELLFRGALQPLAAGWIGPAAAVAAVSLLFGLLHALTATYFALATLVGLYFGWLTERFDDLTAPILAHAAYDYAALALLVRRLPEPTGQRSTTH